MLLLLGVAAMAVRAACRATHRSPAGIRRSLRTSSSPDVGVYDLFAGLLLGGYYDDVAADCAATLGDAGSPSILEIGPGPGHLAERLLALVPDAHWTGLDIDPAMLGAARRRLARAGVGGQASLVEGDVAALPFEDGAFDLVVSSFSAHHWPDAEAGFAELRRVLRPGRTALVYDLPATWGHVETGSKGIDAAAAAFDAPAVSRMRGLGPWTLVHRAELRRAP
jgi:ubiquinone/menaquinone biosynthesis C-methylase UbiE